MRLPVATGIGGQFLSCLYPIGCQNETGVDGIDANIIADDFIGEVFREHDKRRLGDIVDRLVAKRLTRADRGVVEDDAAAAPFHSRHQSARQSYGPPSHAGFQ